MAKNSFQKPSDNSGGQEIVRGNPALRDQVIRLFPLAAFIIVLVAAYVVYRLRQFQDNTEIHPCLMAEQLSSFLYNLNIGLCGLIALAVGWFVVMILRTQMGGSYPPEGMPVVRDTVRRRGNDIYPPILFMTFIACLMAIGGFWVYTTISNISLVLMSGC